MGAQAIPKLSSDNFYLQFNSTKLSNETASHYPMHPSGTGLQLRLNNLKIGYTDDGPDNAPTIVFIHGFPFDKSMWERQIDTLKDNFRVVSYDVRGHGESDIGQADFSIDLFVSDLIALMNHLKIDMAVVCGLSMGGYIALRAMELHPTRLLGLVLCDTQCAADTPEGKEKRMKAIASLQEVGVKAYAESSIPNLFAPESLKTKERSVDFIQELILKTPIKTLCNTLQALAARPETCSRLADVSVPVLILVGKEDKITPVASAMFMHERIRGSSIRIIDDAGHLSNLENPDDFNYQLKEFLVALFLASKFSL
jgi:3-oxoadipate enol-lactonase